MKGCKICLALLLALGMLPAAGLATGSETADTLAFDNGKWQYQAEDDVYWQVGVVYCATPQAPAYESLGIYVPGGYLDAEDNGDGTFTCTIDDAGQVGGFTATNAPVVMPVNTPGYAAQEAPTGYSADIAEYVQAGLVYVWAGCRGRDSAYGEAGNVEYSGGAPWGVTDLKAAVRYLRYNAWALPGDTGNIFTFGMSGGGAQSAVMGGRRRQRAVPALPAVHRRGPDRCRGQPAERRHRRGHVLVPHHQPGLRRRSL